MIYRFYMQKNGMFTMTERHSLSRIAYVSKEKMEELYFDSCYEVIGEISNFLKRYASQDVIVYAEGINIPIFPRGSLRRPFE